MATWSLDPIASYTGAWYLSETLPAAAADDAGNLLIAWVDSTNHLTLSYAKTTSCKALQPNIVYEDVDGSPSVVYSKMYKTFYVLWRNKGTGQLQYGLAQQAGNGLATLDPKGWLVGATSADGPQVTVDASGVIWVAWRGNKISGNDEGLYVSSLAGTSWTLPIARGTSSMNSVYSPALCASTAGVCLVWSGVENDSRLFQGYVSIASSALLSPGGLRSGAITPLKANNRPSLAVSGGNALLVYTADQSIFSTTSSFAGFSNGSPSWTSPVAVPNTLPKPIAVLVAQPTPTSPVYLLVANNPHPNNTVTGFLNLYQYS